MWFYDHCNLALGSCRTAGFNCALLCCKGHSSDLVFWTRVKPRAPRSLPDLNLVVEIATEALDSKENKELGIKITSECLLEGCPSPHPCLQPLSRVRFHYKQCLSHVALGNIKERKNGGEKQNIWGLINGHKDTRWRGIQTAHRVRATGCIRMIALWDNMQREDWFSKSIDSIVSESM